MVLLIADFHQVANLQYHAPGSGSVRQFDRMADAAQPQALDDELLLPVEPDAALAQRDFDCLCHVLDRTAAVQAAPSSSRPRSFSTLPGSRKSMSPWKVARTTLW